MGDETMSSNNSDLLNEAQALAELEAEFQRELERNQAALKLLVARAEEAKIAKSRAELSAKKMECMKIKYNQVQTKLETSRKTLDNAQNRLDRQNQITSVIENLKEKADLISQKQSQDGAGTLQLLAEGADFDFPQPLINYAEEEEKERKLLQQENGEKSTNVKQELPTEQTEFKTQQMENAKPSEPSKKAEPPKIDYAQTVLNLQEKLSRINASTSNSSAASTESKVTEQPKNEVPETPSEDHENLEDALAIDLNESVQRLEAKCAGVREELGRMALSEQYMRTKQAQLRARKEEMKAKEAIVRAEIKEKEAALMRRKVEEMMNLLAARKNKLKTTENVIDKKDQYVQGVTKILQRKERRAYYCEKQKQLEVVYGKDKDKDKDKKK